MNNKCRYVKFVLCEALIQDDKISVKKMNIMTKSKRLFSPSCLLEKYLYFIFLYLNFSFNIVTNVLLQLINMLSFW